MANQIPTSLAGGQVNINQPGDQPAYIPGQGGTAATQVQGVNLMAQSATTPASVSPTSPLGSVMTGLDALASTQTRPTTAPTATPAQTVTNAINNASQYRPTTTANQVVQGALDQFGLPQYQNANQMVQDSISSFENQGSAYMTNAMRRGLETAASRGLGNSSIAAGASQRAALESIQPFVQQAVQTQQQREGYQAQQALNAQNAAVDLAAQREQADLQREMQQVQQELELSRQREQNDFTGQQNELSRQLEERLNSLNQALDLQKQREGLAFQGEQAQLDRDLRTKLQDDQAKQQDWLNSRQFTREFNSALSMIPIKASTDMQQTILQYALENPETYPPSVVSGLTNFFQNNAMSILSQYFPDMVNVKGG